MGELQLIESENKEVFIAVPIQMVSGIFTAIIVSGIVSTQIEILSESTEHSVLPPKAVSPICFTIV